MKTIIRFVLACIVLAGLPALPAMALSSSQMQAPFHLMRYTWQGGNKDNASVTFPVTINKSPDPEHARGFFFFTQYNFTGSKNKEFGYVGLIVPKSDKLQAQWYMNWSLFGKNARVLDHDCLTKVDGVPGFRCLVPVPAFRNGQTYYMTIARNEDKPQIWHAYLHTDPKERGEPVLSAKLGKNWGKTIEVRASVTEFMNNVASCADVPATDVVYGAPVQADGAVLRPEVYSRPKKSANNPARCNGVDGSMGLTPVKVSLGKHSFHTMVQQQSLTEE